MLHLPIALCMVSRGPALLDTKGRAQLLYQGRREVCPPVTQQLSGCSKDCYEVLVEHLHNHPGHLVLCHHSQGIPHEMVGHHQDIFNHGGGLIQLHRGLDTGVIEMHKLQWGICSNQTKGSPQHFSLNCLAVRASPYYSPAILHHHGPPKPFLCESQGPLLALMAGISVYPIKHHAVLSRRDNEGQHSLSLTFQGHVDVHQTLIQDEMRMQKNILPCSISASAPRHSLKRVSRLDGSMPFLRWSHLWHAARVTSTSWACSQSTTFISSSFAA